MEFTVGDVVILKSGGPLMTVAWASAEQVSCMWFNTDTATEPTIAQFLPAVLKKAE
jgi:uncharacterized protein YodC (DUF2158 family)